MKKNNDLSVVNIDEVEMIEPRESVNTVSENDAGKNEEHFHCILFGSMFNSENNLLDHVEEFSD